MRHVRAARLVVNAFALGLSIAWIIWSFGGFTLSDSEAYRLAAERLWRGDDLYVPPATQGEAFRYAPWFAAAWIPLNALPEILGNAIWLAALLAGSIASVLPLARLQNHTARVLALLAGSMLLWTAARGNVHPLVTAALVLGLPRWSGPLWLALAASLKAVPFVFVLVYVANREWRKALVATALTALLVAPMPLLGWDLGSAAPGESLSLFFQVSPAVFAAGASIALGVATVLAIRRSPFTALSSAVAAMALLPRLLLYDMTYVLVEAHRRPSTPHVKVSQ